MTERLKQIRLYRQHLTDRADKRTVLHERNGVQNGAYKAAKVQKLRQERCRGEEFYRRRTVDLLELAQDIERKLKKTSISCVFLLEISCILR